MAAPIGVQQRFERKPLLRVLSRIVAHEAEIPGRGAVQQAADLGDERFEM